MPIVKQLPCQILPHRAPVQKERHPGCSGCLHHTKRRLKKTVALSENLYTRGVPSQNRAENAHQGPESAVKYFHSVQKVSLDETPGILGFSVHAQYDNQQTFPVFIQQRHHNPRGDQLHSLLPDALPDALADLLPGPRATVYPVQTLVLAVPHIHVRARLRERGTLCGVASYAMYYLANTNVVLLGASGAIYALLSLFSALYPRAVIYVFGIIPVQAPFLIIIYFVIELAGGLFSYDGVAFSA